MNKLSQAFNIADKKDALRIRSFEYGGHTFKVRIPLTIESEEIANRLKEPDQEKLNKYYQEYAQPFLDNKELAEESGVEVEYQEHDVIISGRSLKTSAKNKVLMEMRITEMIRLLVPEQPDFDMNTITYEDIEELFPLPVQIELMERISEVVSPGYKDTRGKSSGQSVGK